MSEEVEKASRAYDPMGWSWYDTAPHDHPARPVFYADQISRMTRAITALRQPAEAVVAVARKAQRDCATCFVDGWKSAVDEMLK